MTKDGSPADVDIVRVFYRLHSVTKTSLSLKIGYLPIWRCQSLFSQFRTGGQSSSCFPLLLVNSYEFCTIFSRHFTIPKDPRLYPNFLMKNIGTFKGFFSSFRLPKNSISLVRYIYIYPTICPWQVYLQYYWLYPIKLLSHKFPLYLHGTHMQWFRNHVYMQLQYIYIYMER